MKYFLLALSMLSVSGCFAQKQGALKNDANSAKYVAPGAPGQASVWAYSGKTGIGSSYEAYVDGKYQDGSKTGRISKVWFSIADGILTETMFGLIHQAQIKDLQVLMVGKGFVDSEQKDMTTEISHLHTDKNGRPLSPAYRIVNTDKDGKYQIEKHIFTDPDSQSLMVRYKFTASEHGITPVLTVNPHINNSGSNDVAWTDAGALYASDSGTYLTVKPSIAFTKTSVGFVGESDAAVDAIDFSLDDAYTSTGATAGNVSLTGVMSSVLPGNEMVVDIALGFGYSSQDSLKAASRTLQRGYEAVLASYNGVGEAVGWEDYLASLSGLPAMANLAMDGGALAYASALVLKVQEDKTHSGALIASLSNPWGDTVSAETGATGYKAVWPRDFYQCAMALLALGDKQTPRVAFEYLEKIQVSDSTQGNKGVGGWFLQKTQVDGVLEWVAVQTDQTSMPIMLAWKLWHAGVLSDEEVSVWYKKMLKPAADFLVDGGVTNLDWSNREVRPPWTQQERWEEQSGYSPSSSAATIAGLVTAAEIAEHAGDSVSKERYLKAADSYSNLIEKTMFTHSGRHNHNGRYFLRITENDNPNDDGPLTDRNGQSGLKEKDILDAGFLELVRYGVRAPHDKHIVDSLDELDDESLDDTLRIKYQFSFSGDSKLYPGWRRYGLDGYGEDTANGNNYGAAATSDGMSANQRGRVWPFFTGERAHYELARGSDKQALRSEYVKGLEYFANEGLMLPEQVFDGVGVNPKGRYKVGEGTNSATPLAWTHAEYLKLLRSLADGQVWDYYPPVAERYQAQ